MGTLPNDVLSSEPALVAVLLAGAYDEANYADRSVIERLALRPYAEVRDALGRGSAALVWRGTVVSFGQPDNHFRRLGSFLTPSLLQAFREQAIAVLGETHPRYELPEGGQELSALRGLSIRHSDALRRGLAVSVARLATRLDRVTGQRATPQEYADGIVAELLRGASWQRWASLSALLPTLAEAAPDVFLGAVEDDLRSPRPQVPRLLGDEPGFFGESHRSSLLWALETLGWAPEYLPRVAHLLARLAQLDPGSQYANGPLASLINLFRIWSPQTLADAHVRHVVLENVGRRYGDLGFRLLLELVPEPNEIQVPNATATFRPWIPLQGEPSVRQLRADLKVVEQMLLALAEEQPSRWPALVARMDDLSSPARSRVLAGVRSAIQAGRLPDPEGLRERVEHLLVRYRRSEGSDSTGLCNELQELRAVLPEPKGHRQYVRLFSSSLPVLFDAEATEGEDVFDQLERRRADAIAGLRADWGLAEVAELARVASLPGLVGHALAIGGDGSEVSEVLEWAGADDSRLRLAARAYFATAFKKLGETWLEKAVASPRFRGLPAAARGELLSMLPFGRSTWSRVAAEGGDAVEAYWRIAWPNPPPRGDELREAIVALLIADRAFDAVMLLADADDAPPDLFIRALEKLDPDQDGNRGYWVDRLLAKLDETHAVADEDLARLEIRFLPLGRSFRPRALFRRLASSGSAFADLVRALYRRSDGRADPDPLPDERRPAATLAFQALRRFPSVPGADRRDFEPFLRRWVTEAREALRASGRLAAGDSEIGQLLARAPKDDLDGHFPHRAVRMVLEEVDSSSLEKGFIIGVLNKRGAFWRSLDEGGAQEWRLAQEYRGDAEALGPAWPRTAAALRLVAKRYEADARREDEDSGHEVADVDIDAIVERARGGKS
jgi:hypothetical protein